MDERVILDELKEVYFSAAAHESETLQAVAPLLRRASFFVDVGASLGQFTRHASLTMPGGRVLAVEADPLRVRELQKGCALWQAHSKARLEVVHAAATETDGTARLSVTDTTVSGGLFRHPLEHIPSSAAAKVQWREVEVPAQRLDTLCGGEPPDLVKIDVEGAELRVLRGAEEVLRGGITRFLVEIHPWQDPQGQSSPADVVEFMKSHCYRALPFAGKTLFVSKISTVELCGARQPKPHGSDPRSIARAALDASTGVRLESTRRGS